MAYTTKPPAAGTVTYFTAYYLQNEPARFHSDVLLKVRRSYFSTGKRQKDKVYMTAQGESIRCFYTMEKNKPLKWKKEVNGRQEETVLLDGLSGYRIETMGIGSAIAKKTHFDLSHTWLRTEYLNLEGTKTEAALVPWTSGQTAALALYMQEGTTPVLLSSVPIPEDEAFLSELVSAVEPQACAQTERGLLYFCDDQKLALWQSMLEDRQAKPEEPTVPKPQRRTGGFVFHAEPLREDIADIPFHISKTQDIFGKENASQKQPSAARMRTAKKETDKKPVKKEKTAGKTPQNDKKEPEKNQEKQIENAPAAPADKEKTGKEKKEAPAGKLAVQKKRPGTITADKIIALSAKEKGYYFGPLDENGARTGTGRTQSANGMTLYNGDYQNDMRDGFGAYYFKTGRLSYVGGWKENKRSGFGIALRPTDGSVHVGVFEDDRPCGVAARFDKEGRLTFAGNWSGGAKEGAGVTVEEDGTLTVSGFVNDRQKNMATVLDPYGNVLYSGGYKNGVKEGAGMLFDGAGTLLYSGAFSANEFSGEGTLYLPDGGNIRGSFRHGKANGKAIKRSPDGAVVYDGQWKDGVYHGEGALYEADGSCRRGMFLDGEMSGAFSCYAEDGTLFYKGMLKDGKYDGKGVLYESGQPVYDGFFACGEKSGLGREYRDGVCTYMGSFENGVYSGFGVLCEDSVQVYSGFFSGGAYNGAGVLYENGLPKYAGSFRDGKPDGSVNLVENGAVTGQCLFEDGVCRYERLFRTDGSLSFEGNISGGKKEGMGTTFNAYGEKIFEGIFKFGEPFKSMKVIARALPSLPYIEKLKNTDYEKYRLAPEYAVEQPLSSGMYSGGLKDGVPHGKGTMLYPDHRYTGGFQNGAASGRGVLYLGDGSEIRGLFTAEKTPSSKEAAFASVTYFFEEQPWDSGEL